MSDIDTKIWFYNTVIWRLRQLLPLRYETEYMEGERLVRVRWRMWFGRCFSLVSTLVQ